jgi:uncharacterized protein YndB with AHSA1/START domain
MAGFNFKTSYIVYAKPEQVFEALTDTGIIAAWGGGLAVVSSVPGEPFEMFDGWVRGEVSAYNPGKELGFTWKPEEWNKNTPASNVHMRFTKHAAGTEIFLDHTNFPDEEEAAKHGNGWIDYIFDPINDYFTGGMAESEEDITE